MRGIAHLLWPLSKKVCFSGAAFKSKTEFSGHVKVVKYLVKKVTQFPSDTECYNYIRSIQDKDPELKIRCAQCVETIIAAKDRQEKEANKNAEQLLRQIEEERREEKRKREKQSSKAAKRKANVSLIPSLFPLKLLIYRDYSEKRAKRTRKR